jgi:hypothetical protein
MDQIHTEQVNCPLCQGAPASYACWIPQELFSDDEDDKFTPLSAAVNIVKEKETKDWWKD